MLSDRDRELLDFEARPWTMAGPKESAIARELKISPVRYYISINRMLEDPDALAYRPMLIYRLRRVRVARRRSLDRTRP